ncbi:MAG TPA: hypothetical protein VJH34_03215 [archaeon]|nr:hypothetical protein [archaeon]
MTAKIDTDSGSVRLYHGTSSVFLNQILDQGLLPGLQTGVYNWDNQRHLYGDDFCSENCIYLTDNYDSAMVFGGQAVENSGGELVVFEVEIDKRCLTPDKYVKGSFAHEGPIAVFRIADYHIHHSADPAELEIVDAVEVGL